MIKLAQILTVYLMHLLRYVMIDLLWMVDGMRLDWDKAKSLSLYGKGRTFRVSVVEVG